MKNRFMTALLAAALCLALLAGCGGKAGDPVPAASSSAGSTSSASSEPAAAAPSAEPAEPEPEKTDADGKSGQVFKAGTHSNIGCVSFTFEEDDVKQDKGTIYCNFDGKDPLENGVLRADVQIEHQKKQEFYMLPCFGSYALRARYQYEDGTIGDLLEYDFVLAGTFSESSDFIAEDNQYEYYSSGEGVYRYDRETGKVDLYIDAAPISLAAKERDYEPNALDPEYIRQNSFHSHDLRCLTEEKEIEKSTRVYSYDGRTEDFLNEEKRMYKKNVHQLGPAIVESFSDGSGSANWSYGLFDLIKEVNPQLYVSGSGDNLFTVNQPDGAYSVQLIQRPYGKKGGLEDCSVKELFRSDREVVLDALWQTEDWINYREQETPFHTDRFDEEKFKYEHDYASYLLFYHYADTPAEHMIYAGGVGQTIKNEQAAGYTILGYTSQAFYYLDENGTAQRQPMNYYQYTNTKSEYYTKGEEEAA